jgi:hypothetical protein
MVVSLETVAALSLPGVGSAKRGIRTQNHRRWAKLQRPMPNGRPSAVSLRERVAGELADGGFRGAGCAVPLESGIHGDARRLPGRGGGRI